MKFSDYYRIAFWCVHQCGVLRCILQCDSIEQILNSYLFACYYSQSLLAVTAPLRRRIGNWLIDRPKVLVGNHYVQYVLPLFPFPS